MKFRICFAMLLSMMCVGASAQVGELSHRSLVGDDHKTSEGSVSYLFPEQITAPVGKATTVAMRFRVADGMHINSHTPKDSYLIPTVFSFPDGAGARLEKVTYPAGVLTVLPMDPKEKLSVYTGEFTLLVRIVAQSGDHLMKAQLHYQACDNNACMPPRTLTVGLDVKGRE